MATSTVKRATPRMLDESEYTVTPASGYGFPIIQIQEILPDVFYLHLNVTGTFPKHTYTVAGELRIRGRIPFANQLICRVSLNQANATFIGAQWLTSGDIRITNDTGTDMNETAMVDGLVILQP